MDEKNLGVREARRNRHWTQIHEAAVLLVLENGLPATTIDAIAAAAGVSRRSFFNYFPTKEDAVLGTVIHGSRRSSGKNSLTQNWRCCRVPPNSWRPC